MPDTKNIKTHPYPGFENTLVIPKDSPHKTAMDALAFANQNGYPYVFWNNAIWYLSEDDKPDIMYVQKRLELSDLHQQYSERDWIWNKQLMAAQFE